MSLSARHLQDLHLPDKAIDVLDEAGAAQKMLPAAERTTRIGAAQVEKIVAKMARVPVQTVSSDDKRALERLDVELKTVIFGQNGPIDEVASAIKLSRSGLRAPDKPIGNFLFAGPTGVGKTELARQLARVMGIEFIRFDMSEYMEKHAVSRLIGAPPGYVGYEEGGLLIDAIRKAPHAVLLLDEIEKAHPDMFSILLQVMDHATLTDSHGRKADFRHVVLIMTTNAGARDLSDRRLGFTEQGKGGSSRGALERTFTPEFRNRLDATVTFGALGMTEIERVVDKQIDEVRGMVAAKNVTIVVDPAARTWLALKGFDRAFGARPMARLIERVIKKPLSEMLLFGSLADSGGERANHGGERRHPAGPRSMSLADVRREYLGQPLSETDSEADPFVQFARWFEQARETETDATAMALATATREGRPSVRNVLLKGVDDRGLVFYTNYQSRKASELEATGRASLLFTWRTSRTTGASGRDRSRECPPPNPMPTSQAVRSRAAGACMPRGRAKS